jgi:hypothetical protein
MAGTNTPTYSYYTVQLAFSSHLTTTAVSDGGVHNYESNFGVVIADQHKVITTNMGKLYSIDFYESSHRSEMYGVLSALATIKHLISEFDISIPPGKQFQLYCDNRSVVDKISYRRQLRRTVNQH